MRIAVQGVGVVGGFGCGVQDFALALARGSTPAGVLQVPTGREIPALRADPSPLDRFVPRRNQRRLDFFSRMTALGAHLALEDAGVLAEDHGTLAVVVASGYGATGATMALIDSIIEGGDACTSPIHFAGSLHNTPAAHLSILLGAKGPSLSVSQFQLSAPTALMAARLWLEQGRVERVLFGAVDELSELIGHLWARQGELERPWGPGPAGEGAAFLLLSSHEEAREPYCILEQAVTGQGPAPALAPGSLLLLDGGEDPAASGLPAHRLAPVYGHMPPAPAFDLAAAAILLRQGEDGPPGFRDARGAAPESIACLTRADEGFGLASVRSCRR
jgi:3-oxoacyl-[acyl-carrier-protein] synthase II